MRRRDDQLALLAVAAAVVLLAVMAGAGYWIGVRVNSSNDRLAAQRVAIHESCIAIRNLNVVITRSLARSKRNLPKLSYYRQHPAELASQEAEIGRQLGLFRPRTCR